MTNSKKIVEWTLPRENAKSTTGISAVYFIIIIGLLFSPGTRLLVYLFPALSFVFALATYNISRKKFAFLACWLWMLTPLIRRVVDYRLGGQTAVLVNTAPFIVCAIPFLDSLRRPKELLSRGSYPLLLAFSGVFYGLGIGLIQHNVVKEVASQLLFWMAPLLFGFFILRSKDVFDQISESVESAFLWGMLLLSCYGIYQYLFLTPWDTLWMETSGLISIGIPEPRQFHVFSTLNSPQVFSSFLVAGLFLAIRSSGKLKWFVIPAASLCLVLTQSRTAWLGFLLGIVYMIFYLPTRQKLQVVMLAAVTALIVAIGLQSEESDELLTRFSSVSSLNDDGSYNARSEGYKQLAHQLTVTPFGGGVGFSEANETSEAQGGLAGDSAIGTILGFLGIPGGLAYFAALFAAFLIGFRLTPNDKYPQLIVYRSIMISSGFAMIGTDIVEGPSGFLFWLAICATLTISAKEETSQASHSASHSTLSTKRLTA